MEEAVEDNTKPCGTYIVQSCRIPAVKSAIAPPVRFSVRSYDAVWGISIVRVARDFHRMVRASLTLVSGTKGARFSVNVEGVAGEHAFLAGFVSLFFSTHCLERTFQLQEASRILHSAYVPLVGNNLTHFCIPLAHPAEHFFFLDKFCARFQRQIARCNNCLEGLDAFRFFFKLNATVSA